MRLSYRKGGKDHINKRVAIGQAKRKPPITLPGMALVTPEQPKVTGRKLKRDMAVIGGVEVGVELRNKLIDAAKAHGHSLGRECAILLEQAMSLKGEGEDHDTRPSNGAAAAGAADCRHASDSLGLADA